MTLTPNASSSEIKPGAIRSKNAPCDPFGTPCFPEKAMRSQTADWLELSQEYAPAGRLASAVARRLQACWLAAMRSKFFRSRATPPSSSAADGWAELRINPALVVAASACEAEPAPTPAGRNCRGEWLQCQELATKANFSAEWKLFGARPCTSHHTREVCSPR